ncbi:MAG: hypothetical protein CEE40_03020 [Chloroflexi bacterium B3_Chlor]|nr:MAG: hypothetical protein CEE40_03020 [Chloroflexi bacterium B3_Chlor]
MDFKEAQSKYAEVKGRLEAGTLSPEQFQAQVGQLRVQDGQGRYWAIDARSGGWLLYDGADWTPAQPPDGVSPLAPPTYPHTPGRRGVPIRVIGAVAVAALLCLVALGGGGLILSRSRGVRDEAVISQEQAGRIADHLIGEQFPDLRGAERTLASYENPAGAEFWTVTYRRQVQIQVEDGTYTIPRIVIVSVDKNTGQTSAAVSD